MPELFDPSVPDMIREVEREITLRRAVYPGLVARKKLTQARADRQIALMEAVRGNLEVQLECLSL